MFKILKNKSSFIALDSSVFVCGAMVMIFELVGSRILAPYLGNSIYVWTSLIGVILGSLSLGYWLGGRLADKKTSWNFYGAIIFWSALSIYLVFLYKDICLQLFSQNSWPIEINSLLVSMLIFAPSSVLLGIISPYAVKIKLNNLETSASTIGNLYALSTLGSIAGTFFAGFYLIPHLGSDNIILLIASVLALVSLSLTKKKIFIGAIALLLLTVLLSGWWSYKNSKELYQKFSFLDTDTPYNKIIIFKGEKNGRPTLNLATDPFGVQSAIYLDSEELVSEYAKYYRLSKFWQPNIKKALLLGGCAYVYPRDFLKQNPEAVMDVVEIDPGMTEVAKKYFRLKEEPRLNIFHQDARIFLNTTKNKYDVIYGDAFNSFSALPFHLTTKEAVQKQYDILNNDGLVMVNMISAIDGPAGKFLQTEYKTYKSVFPQVYIFPVNTNKSEEMQNIILVASRAKLPLAMTSSDVLINDYLKKRWSGLLVSDLQILTDDFAPVEYYKRQSLVNF